MMTEFSAAFHELKRLSTKDNYGTDCSNAILNAISAGRRIIANTDRIKLTSKVSGKEYFAFHSDAGISRAINTGLYDDNESQCQQRLKKLLYKSNCDLSAEEINSAIYTGAISFFAANDILKKNDQKTPGTFFEYLCAAVVRNILGVVPSKSLSVMNLDRDEKLPTDFIFDLGRNRPKFHIPVKTSTRERIIQVWAHQRVIDGVYGTGRFLGCPIILGENKTNSQTREVVEICLPSQWRLYQMHISQLWRIAYLDIPAQYKQLSNVFPPVPVFTLGHLISKDGDLREIVDKSIFNL